MLLDLLRNRGAIISPIFFILIIHFSIRGFVKCLDKEDYEFFHGEDAKGRSVYIQHVPAMVVEETDAKFEQFE